MENQGASHESKLTEDQLQKLRERVSASQQKRSVVLPEKKGFNYEEYARRVNGDIATTTKFFENKHNKRIQVELQKWHDRVGERFANAKVEDPEIKRKIDTKIDNMKAGRRHANSLLLIGHLGVGKTWNAYAYIERMIREGLVADSEIFMGTESEVLRPITQAGFRQPDEEAKLLSRRHKVYFIDEVGRSKYRDQESRESIWLMLINHAYRYNLPVIVTSNLHTVKKEVTNLDGTTKMASEMEMWIGDAAMDRLRYMVGDNGIIVPENVNKRPQHNRFMDEGKNNASLYGEG